MYDPRILSLFDILLAMLAGQGIVWIVYRNVPLEVIHDFLMR